MKIRVEEIGERVGSLPGVIPFLACDWTVDVCPREQNMWGGPQAACLPGLLAGLALFGQGVSA